MIRPEELRIGNLVYIPGTGQALPITAINMDLGVWVNRSLGLLGFDQIDPIELTEDWMLKFGFVKKWDNMPGLGIIEFYEHQLCKHRITPQLRMPIVGLDIKSVHQLQNLYFALTGEELTVNPIVK